MPHCVSRLEAVGAERSRSRGRRSLENVGELDLGRVDERIDFSLWDDFVLSGMGEQMRMGLTWRVNIDNMHNSLVKGVKKVGETGGR